MEAVKRKVNGRSRIGQYIVQFQLNLGSTSKMGGNFKAGELREANGKILPVPCPKTVPGTIPYPLVY
jgi:hypothetical protein